jgi:uncharacterized protein YcbK (DUF882 family)
MEVAEQLYRKNKRLENEIITKLDELIARYKQDKMDKMANYLKHLEV